MKQADATLTNNDGETLLHAAAAHAHVRAAEVLIQLGARLDAIDRYGHTPLHYMLRYCNFRDDNDDHISFLKNLLTNGLDANVGNEGGRTLLHAGGMACARVRAMEVLIQHGARLEARDRDGHTPLHDMLRYCYFRDDNDDHISFLKNLLTNGLDVNLGNEGGRTLLHAAASRAHVRAMEVLIQHGARLDVRARYGNTPLHDMLRYDDFRDDNDDHISFLKNLLTNGLDANLGNEGGRTLLHAAAGRAHVRAAEVLIQHGARLDARGLCREYTFSLFD